MWHRKPLYHDSGRGISAATILGREVTIVNHSEFLSDYIDKHGPGKDAKFDSKESAFASMWDLISAAQAAWKKEISLSL